MPKSGCMVVDGTTRGTKDRQQAVFMTDEQVLTNYAKEENGNQYHIPYHNYAGPGTHTISNLLNGLEPVDYIDKAALVHDIEYLREGNKLAADYNMFKNLNRQRPDLLLINTAIFLGLVASTPFYNPQKNHRVYQAARNKVERDFQGVSFY